MKKFLLKLVLSILSCLIISGCTVDVETSDDRYKEDTVTGIRISQVPNNITYEEGSELNLEGLCVEVLYESGKTKIINDYSTRPENHSVLNEIGINTVYIYYQNFETTTFVTVNKKVISEIISSSYFWGNWQRMDSGDVYVIDETSVRNSERIEKIISATDSSIQTETGVFQKQSEQVLIKDSIPYFRQGGINLSYSLKIVGFADEISSRAVSSFSGIKGLKGVGKSKKFSSFSSENESNEDGLLYLTAPTANDVQTVSIKTDSSLVVVPNIVITNDGDFMGTVPIVGKNDYSLKITGNIDASEKNEGYLYGNFYKEYPLELTITNISNIDSSPLLCIIEPENDQLIVNSSFDISGIPISSLKSGLTKTINLKVQFGSIYDSYVDTGLNIYIKDSKTNREWTDYIPLRFYKGLMPVTIAARSTENNEEAALNGFIIYPDGNSQFFSVQDNAKKVLYVPTFGKTKNYLLAFSGANVSGELSNSTEMFYTVSICSSTAKNVAISGNDAFLAMQFGESNETEDTAHTINNEFEAYIADGDIDFFKFEAESSVILLPNELSICEIFYQSDFGTVPESVRLASGTILTDELLPELSKEGWYFEGWFDGETKLDVGDDIKGSVRATAKWHKLYTVSFESEKGNAPESIQIPADLPYKAEMLPIIEKQGSYKHLGWCLKDTDNVINELVINENITLYAKWVLSECVLNYSTEFGSSPSQKDFAYNTILSDEDLPELDYEGYTFLGWYIGENKVSGGYVLQKNEALTAKWKIKTYEISYFTQYGSAPEPFTADYGENFTQEELPSLIETGYTFVGWYCCDDMEGTIITTNDVINRNVQLIAEWRINSYTVKYETEHGVAPQSFIREYKSNFSKSDLPFLHDDGFNFLGWYVDDVKVTESYLIKTDITLTAKWEAFIYHVGDIVLEDGSRIDPAEFSTYSIDSGNKPVAVIFSETDVVNNLPAKGIGLYQSTVTMAWAQSSSNLYNEKLEELEETKTDGFNNWIYFKYKYKSEFNSASSRMPCFYWANNYGTSYCSDNLVCNWYLPTISEFNDIYDNKEVINNALKVASGNVLSDNEYWTSTQSSSADQRSTSIYLKDGSKNDYLKNKSLYVRAVRNFGTMHTVVFDSDGGTKVDEQTVKNGCSLIEPFSPKKQGCKFVGWYLNENEYSFDSLVTESVTLKAHWEGANIPIAVEEYEIGDIVLRDGTVLRNIQETLSKEQIENAIAVIFRVNTRNQKALGIGLKTTSAQWCTDAKGRSGYFNSWNAICSGDPEGAANAQTKYPAFYWINNYSILAGYTGELAEGWYMPTQAELVLLSNSISVINKSFSYLSLSNVANVWSSTTQSKSGNYYYAYVFNEGAIDKYYSRNVYAIREFGTTSPTYTVTFHSGESNEEKKIIVDSGRVCTEPSFTNDGYVLEGWYLNDEKFDFGTPITGDITLTAKWNLKYSPIEVDLYKVGDILLKDGKVFRNVDSSLSSSQKQDAIAVIFREENGTEPALGVGLKQGNYQWCTSNARGCSYNWNSWEEIVFNDKSGSENAETYYPAFYWVNNYTDFISYTGENFVKWYMPTYSEGRIIEERNTSLRNKISNAGGDNLTSGLLTSMSVGNKIRLTNMQDSTKSNAGNTRAILSIKSVTVTFDTTKANQFINIQRIVKGKKCTKPNDPTLSYCTFKGWYLNGDLFDFDSEINEDITLEAKWDYTILPEEVTEYKIGDAVTNDGKVFRNIDASKLPAAQKQEIVAIIIKNADDSNPALGIGLRQTSCEWGRPVFGNYQNFEELKVSYTGSAKAYEFAGALVSDDKWDYIRSVEDKYSTYYSQSASSYYPAWSYVNSYGRNYCNNSENFIDGWFLPNVEMLQYLSCNYEDINAILTNYSGTALTASNYWSCNQATDSTNVLAIIPSTGVINSTTQGASRVVRPMRYFGGKTVRFDSDGGTEVITKVILSGNKITEPAIPIKENGFVFDNWYLNDKIYDFNEPVYSDITLTAHWKESNNVPIETKEYEVGDIVLENGKVLRNIEGTLTEELKNQAIALIYKATETGNDALGFGLNISDALSWAADGTTGYSTNFSGIQGTVNSGDMDGSDNWEYISSINPIGASDAAKNYPAFDYANNYSDSLDVELKTGWYIPSIYELNFFEESTMRDVYWKLGKGSVYGITVWSSSQDSSATKALYKVLGGGCYTSAKNSQYKVMVIKRF